MPKLKIEQDEHGVPQKVLLDGVEVEGVQSCKITLEPNESATAEMQVLVHPDDIVVEGPNFTTIIGDIKYKLVPLGSVTKETQDAD